MWGMGAGSSSVSFNPRFYCCHHFLEKVTQLGNGSISPWGPREQTLPTALGPESRPFPQLWATPPAVHNGFKGVRWRSQLDCKHPEGRQCAFQSWGFELGLNEIWLESYQMDLSQHQRHCAPVADPEGLSFCKKSGGKFTVFHSSGKTLSASRLLSQRAHLHQGACSL